MKVFHFSVSDENSAQSLHANCSPPLSIRPSLTKNKMGTINFPVFKCSVVHEIKYKILKSIKEQNRK
jgi:hypothetical protein